MNKAALFGFLGFVSLAAGACGGGDEPGTLTIAIYGEEFIEDGIPAGEFADGWSVEFDRFLVVVGNVSAQAGHEEVAFEQGEHVVVDLAQSSGGQGYVIAQPEVAAGAYDHLTYRIGSNAAATALNATPDDVALMADNGYGIYVEGTATNGSMQKSFAWGFTSQTSYSHCEGTAVIDGNDARTELTIHGDHLFYDDLVSSEPNLAFDLMATADEAGDADGSVTQAELAAMDITAEERYQVGNLDVTDLWNFLDHQTSTLGHIDGEGHCEEAVRSE